MKRLLLFVALCVVLLTACGRYREDQQSGVIIDVTDDTSQWLKFAELRGLSWSEDYEHYYLVYSHIGVVEDEEFIAAYLGLEDLGLQKDEAELYLFPSRSVSRAIYILATDEELESLSIDIYAEPEIHCVGERVKRSELPEFTGSMSTSSPIMFTISTDPDKPTGTWMLNNEKGIRLEEGLMCFPIKIYGGMDIPEIHAYIEENIIFGRQRFGYKNDYETVEGFKVDILEYGEEGYGIDWSLVENTIGKDKNFENALYFKYDIGENGVVTVGTVASTGDIAWLCDLY